MTDYRAYLPQAETPPPPEQINTIQDVVNQLSSLFTEIREKGEMADKELKYYRLLLSDWSKQMIAAIKERDSHSPEIQAKQLEEQLRIVNGARRLSFAQMHQILTSRNFTFSLEQYVVDAEVIETDSEKPAAAPPGGAIARLQDSGINLSDYFDASGMPKDGSPEAEG